LSLLTHKEFWSPQVLTCSARDNVGLDQYWDNVEKWYQIAQTKHLNQKREAQTQQWLKDLLGALMEEEIKTDTQLEKLWIKCLAEVRANSMTPFQAATKLLKTFRNS